MGSDYENILVEVDGPVATLTINRPKVMNALNAQTLGEMACAMDALGADDAALSPLASRGEAGGPRQELRDPLSLD